MIVKNKNSEIENFTRYSFFNLKIDFKVVTTNDYK